MIDNSIYTVSVSECMMEFGYRDASSGISQLLENAADPCPYKRFQKDVVRLYIISRIKRLIKK